MSDKFASFKDRCNHPEFERSIRRFWWLAAVWSVPCRLCGPRLAPKDNCAVFAGCMQANFTFRTPFD